MRKLELVATLAALALATPAMAQGRRHDNGFVPPGQRGRAATTCRTANGMPTKWQPAASNCGYSRTTAPNGQVIYGSQSWPSGRQYPSNERAVWNHGRRCVQRVVGNGHERMICADGDGDHDDRVVARAQRAQNSRWQANEQYNRNNNAYDRRSSHRPHDHDDRE